MAQFCSVCGEPLPEDAPPGAPFCSARCRVIDLGRWATNAYAIPGEPVMPAEDLPGSEDEE